MSTFREDLRAGCHAVLVAYKAAHPTQLAHVYASRPGSYRTPCAFVDSVILEPSILHDSGTRRRELVARVYIVNKLVSGAQAADEQDVLVDGLVDAFTDNPRAADTGQLMEPVSVDGDTVVDGEATYAASVINVRGRALEPRL